MTDERCMSRGAPEGARGDRVDLVLRCEVRQGTRAWKPVVLEDLSPSGFRISGWQECRSELTVRIRIPGLQMLNANVRWQRGDEVGCEFTSPLHVAVFEHIVRRAHAQA